MSPAPVSDQQLDDLIRAAREIRRNAHVPYSGFHVGAAILMDGDRVFTGANIENASYPLSVCAERTAIGTGASAGARSLDAVAVVADAAEPTAPCGGCRQVLMEFGRADTPVVLEGAEGGRVRYTLADLLPHAFSFDR